ncbi:protein translocase subunit SecD [Frigoribacterium sp. CFBP9039]|uniref:protein translocase subunit SecD n=1 Tax=Frigoribacterium TaxID=96492 RepID=UPI001FAC58E9|nr:MULTISPECIES: protein translocase subunit SecD [Frigoribacterium]MCJ0699537.1 protein translocase subunit SecD [Frigoribacterium faeni]MDY0891074.1 protein translocase subunit SecD [Frigoribacterium sp. CFBP9030]MDY0944967.1 protein translocase subunit SecD [Frigoribacterium sp. CFBP9039]
MARSTPVKKAIRSLTWLLVIIAGLTALNGTATVLNDSGRDGWWNGASWVPELALDLQGGTQITLAAQLQNGETVSSQQLDQAVTIIRQRIDSAGVSESEITKQGSQNIVVSIPGRPDNATLERIEASAKLSFRPVLFTGAASSAEVGGEADGASASPSAGSTTAPYTPNPDLESTPTASPTNGSDLAWITPQLADVYENYNCAADNDLATAPDDEPLVTCSTDGTAKYILGPVEVAGSDISDATNGLATDAQGNSTNTWAVNLEFDGQGTDQFADVTSRLVTLQAPQNQFAVTLDNQVITAPSANAAITDGRAQITGQFTQDSSKALADQLKFGALPLSFSVQSNETITATLGQTQLVSGLIAGLIGLILVVIYSLIQYRALAFVTVLSLIIAAVLTYLVIAILSWREGYRLSLAGVTGLIVAIGITADSFIVYFERIRDELRDGRILENAVESGWKRAIRTIIASDTVNFLAAITLFILAVGNVKGFALTLGITTVIDLIVVSLFTHPMLQLIARTRFFGEGHSFSGLNPRALGAVYRGRAQFREPVVARGRKKAGGREAVIRQTIAERKAAEKNTRPGDNASGDEGTNS